MNQRSDSLKLLLKLISNEKLAFFKTVFQRFDVHSSGTLNVPQLNELLRSMGRRYSEQQIQNALTILTDNPETNSIGFEQFAALMQFDLLGTSSPLPKVSVDTQPEPIQILYFIDVLCIWAYVSQIRIDELNSTFKDQIQVNYHFVPIFGDVHRKLEKRWRDRGGIEAYSKHVKEVVDQFNHVNVHPEVWKRVTPLSSNSCHLFLRAVKLVEEKDLIENDEIITPFEQVLCACREAFFKDVKDICDRKVQFEIAESLNLPVSKIEGYIDSGKAYGDLSRDFELVKDYTVTTSPSLILNEGRQRLYGNVGYRVMESNIRDVINAPLKKQSWC